MQGVAVTSLLRLTPVQAPAPFCITVMSHPLVPWITCYRTPDRCRTFALQQDWQDWSNWDPLTNSESTTTQSKYSDKETICPE